MFTCFQNLKDDKQVLLTLVLKTFLKDTEGRKEKNQNPATTKTIKTPRRTEIIYVFVLVMLGVKQMLHFLEELRTSKIIHVT